MKKICLLKPFIMLSLTLPVVSSFAQNPDEIKKQVAELSKTNTNHQLLASTVGNWSFTGKHIFPNPDSKPVQFKGTAVKKALWGGRYFLTEHTSGEKIKMPWSEELVYYHDMFVEAYDNAKAIFTTAMFTNESETGIITMEGNYDPQTKTITYSCETTSHLHTDLAPGTVIQIRHLLKFVDKDHFILERHESVAGKEIIMTELSYTKTKSQK